MAQFSFNLAPERRVWSVSELNARIRGVLEAQFRDLWVEGEISNCRPAQSGHLYFTLKDDAAQIRCVCFRNQARLLKFQPEDGLHVTARGSLSVYEQRGDYQLYVEHLEPVGVGSLQLAFEQLKKRLEAEGLFDAARKKPLPVLPRRIGIITSPAGAAVRDILRILRQRFPNANVLVYPVRVQGDGACDDIVRAIGFLNRSRLVDVMILARGGGSLEDLWAFNEEDVARAIAASQIPVISGVGHETDFTIADFVADVRASTPSNAAEVVVRTRQEFDRHLADLERQLVTHARYRLAMLLRRVQDLRAHPGFRRLSGVLRQRRMRADELSGRLGELLRRRLDQSRRRLGVAQLRVRSFDLRARIGALRARFDQRAGELAERMQRRLANERHRLERAMLQLDERSPIRVLERGYAIAYDAAGNVLRSADQVALGDEIRVQLASGRLSAEVKKKGLG
ncbi:MAG: exodeoxyribonuclease VII large subunit [Candidatus Acidiferrales bacterium]